ncbi:gephyrin-like molybdotransferase Glp [Saccharopolyspora flava]|uniref:Molybdopterin molybdenumtransferase n=1 Tax=Saccharopolyspora flava TaxID=95161 RepID=A0A1I6QW40_9PSEU|nr:gephyrin-like molybdotransferase Glp [Saccharopolyspora flava]SFS56645.1 molybdopterin molybdochelatase [Saccharopolyspora flava]
MTDDACVSNNTAPELRSVADHRAEVASLLTRTPVETRPLENCLGLALASDLVAPISLPPFSNSAMDGYAVRSVDLTEAAPESPVTLPVAEDIPAGRVDVPPLQPGTAHRIMTGAQLPPGADSVIPVERTDAGTKTVALFGSVQPGASVRRAGDDVTEGTTVLTAGTRLGAAQLAVAAAVGVAELPVHRPVRVLVLSTGSELVAPGGKLEPGQIYESNGLMLAAAVREAGGEATVLRFVPDDVEAFHAALAEHLDSADLLLTSGGVSAGAYEVVKDALSGNGVEFTKVAMQPGMPQGCGRYRDAFAVVTLPGNPVSSMVSFEVFVRPALLAAAGHARTSRHERQAVLTEALTAPAGKRQFRRGVFDPATGEVGLQGASGSHLLGSLAKADCLLSIPEEVTDLPVGSTVDVVLLD